MLKAKQSKDPIVPSYLALRSAVGWVAFGLPFVLVIPWLVSDHCVMCSISGYYYTGMRNVFVGGLCAIGLFMFCCRGYDLQDEIAGILSSICAFGVAWCPTALEDCTKEPQDHSVGLHYLFAAILFAILAYFCLVLFKMSAEDRELTDNKERRNKVYTWCGCVIVLSMAGMLLLHLFNVDCRLGLFAPRLFFESLALWAFGIAWLIKGETFLKDAQPVPPSPVTTDSVFVINHFRP